LIEWDYSFILKPYGKNLIKIFITGISRESCHPVFESHPEADKQGIASALDSRHVGAVDRPGERLAGEREPSCMLAGKLYKDKATFTRIIASIEAQELVVRVPGPKDVREKIVYRKERRESASGNGCCKLPMT